MYYTRIIYSICMYSRRCSPQFIDICELPWQVSTTGSSVPYHYQQEQFVVRGVPLPLDPLLHQLQRATQ